MFLYAILGGIGTIVNFFTLPEVSSPSAVCRLITTLIADFVHPGTRPNVQ